MMNRLYKLNFTCVIFSLLLVSTNIEAAIPETKATKARGPACIAGFCFDKVPISESTLTGGYGQGYVSSGISRTHCYYAREVNHYVYFQVHHDLYHEVVGIFVSDVPACKGAYPPTKQFETIETREGLKIGDPESKIISMYGKPDRVESGTGLQKIGLAYREAMSSKPFGDRVFVYSQPSPDDLLTSNIYIRNGKVSAIFISNSE